MLYEVITLRCNFDTGNTFIAGHDPLDYLKTLRKYVVHCHIKDVSPALAAAVRGEETGIGSRITSYNVCYTKLLRAENLIFKIKPNSLDLSNHLTDSEKENLITRKKELNKILTANEVADRLIIEEKVPVWINCSVIRSTKKKTTIGLFTSRRFREDSELYHKNETVITSYSIHYTKLYDPGLSLE